MQLFIQLYIHSFIHFEICHGLKLPVAKSCGSVLHRLTCGTRPELRGLPHERVKSQLKCLYRGIFSAAPGSTRDGLVATPRLPRQVPRGIQLWTGSTVPLSLLHLLGCLSHSYEGPFHVSLPNLHNSHSEIS